LRLAARSAGQLLTGLDYSLPVASAQVKTCLLLAALGADRASTLREPELSRDHSERMLAAMGVDVRVEGSQVVLVPPNLPGSRRSRWHYLGYLCGSLSRCGCSDHSRLRT